MIDAERPGSIVVARNGSPLVLGIGDSEMFFASDPAALVRHTAQVVHLDDGEIAAVRADGYETRTLDGAATTKTPSTIPWKDEAFDKGQFTHYMRKEIGEQPEAVRRTLSGRLDMPFPDHSSRRDRARRARPARHPPRQDPGLRRGLLRRPASART